MSVILWESVAEPEPPFVSCHCSVIQQLDSGDLVVGYYAGSGEARPDAAWVMARRRPGAQAFSRPAVVADTPGKPEGNGILYQNAQGRLLLVYGTMHGKLDGPPGPGVRWVTCDLRMKTSDDRGETWSDVTMIEEDLGHVPRCKPIRLSDGRLLFGTEYKDGHSRIFRSEDDGATWGEIAQIPGEPNMHPTLVARGDGSVLALLRPAGGQRCVLRSHSTDAGQTWAPAERTQLDSVCAAIDAVRMADGRVALVWNHSREVRNPLTLALSEDEGDTWPCVRDLVTGEGEFHYPAMIQSRDGHLHISFTNNRRTIDHVELLPEWIEGKGKERLAWDGSKRRKVA
jgi:predicted neuraminidase